MLPQDISYLLYGCRNQRDSWFMSRPVFNLNPRYKLDLLSRYFASLLGEEFYLMSDWGGILVTCFISPLKMLSPLKNDPAQKLKACCSQGCWLCNDKIGGRWRSMKFNSGQSYNNLLPQWFKIWSGTTDMWLPTLHLLFVNLSFRMTVWLIGVLPSKDVRILPS